MENKKNKKVLGSKELSHSEVVSVNGAHGGGVIIPPTISSLEDKELTLKQITAVNGAHGGGVFIPPTIKSIQEDQIQTLRMGGGGVIIPSIPST